MHLAGRSIHGQEALRERQLLDDAGPRDDQRDIQQGQDASGEGSLTNQPGDSMPPNSFDTAVEGNEAVLTPPQ